ncbi:hypothetical protein DXV76_15200 [Rhodobacteraceae bacterium CCMM004]|nr:hypothetical protein DXV76_15200 [Rhodobacteraceae bacterium CCMM004]
MSRIWEFDPARGTKSPAKILKEEMIMYFKDLTAKVAALLKPKTAEPSKNKPDVNAPDTSSTSRTPNTTKS